MTDIKKLAGIAHSFNCAFADRYLSDARDGTIISTHFSVRDRQLLARADSRAEDSVTRAEILMRAACHSGVRGKKLGETLLPAEVRTPENKAALKAIAPFFSRGF